MTKKMTEERLFPVKVEEMLPHLAYVLPMSHALVQKGQVPDGIRTVYLPFDQAPGEPFPTTQLEAVELCCLA